MTTSISSKYIIRRIHTNAMGYDRHGKYYGRGAPLFCAEHKETGDTVEFRAADYRRASAELEKILAGHRYVPHCEGCRMPNDECQCSVWPDVQELKP